MKSLLRLVIGHQWRLWDRAERVIDSARTVTPRRSLRLCRDAAFPRIRQVSVSINNCGETLQWFLQLQVYQQPLNYGFRLIKRTASEVTAFGSFKFFEVNIIIFLCISFYRKRKSQKNSVVFFHSHNFVYHSRFIEKFYRLKRSCLILSMLKVIIISVIKSYRYISILYTSMA